MSTRVHVWLGSERFGSQTQLGVSLVRWAKRYGHHVPMHSGFFAIGSKMPDCLGCAFIERWHNLRHCGITVTWQEGSMNVYLLNWSKLRYYNSIWIQRIFVYTWLCPWLVSTKKDSGGTGRKTILMSCNNGCCGLRPKWLAPMTALTSSEPVVLWSAVGNGPNTHLWVSTSSSRLPMTWSLNLEWRHYCPWGSSFLTSVHAIKLPYKSI